MGWKGNRYFSGGKQIRSWKTLRDADGMGVLVDPKKLVDWFDDFLGPNPYAALSNFYVGEPIPIPGEGEYLTGEHAFHAGKAATESGRKKVQAAKTADEAKQIGRSIRMRPDWDDVRVDRMAIVIRAKFARGREEADVLLGTGRAKLVEGSLWRDAFWGVDLEESGRPGENQLGRILTARRTALRR